MVVGFLRNVFCYRKMTWRNHCIDLEMSSARSLSLQTKAGICENIQSYQSVIVGLFLCWSLGEGKVLSL